MAKLTPEKLAQYRSYYQRAALMTRVAVICDLLDHIDALEEEAGVANLDTKRLDWLSDTERVMWREKSFVIYGNRIDLVCCGVGEPWPGCGQTYATAHEVIDAAMAKENENA